MKFSYPTMQRLITMVWPRPHPPLDDEASVSSGPTTPQKDKAPILCRPSSDPTAASSSASDDDRPPKRNDDPSYRRCSTVSEQSYDLSTEQSPLIDGPASRARLLKQSLVRWHAIEWPCIWDLTKAILLRILKSIWRHPFIMAILMFAMCFAAFVLRIFFPPDPSINAPWMPDYAGLHNFTIPPYRPELLATNYSLPLRTAGRYIVDQDNRRFKLSSINWYGASDELWVPGGLDIRHRDEIAELIRDLGFNSVRLPYSDEMVVKNPEIPARDVAANPDLHGKRALDVFAATVESLTKAGIAVIVNDHITRARWCCDGDPCDSAWSNSYLGAICSVRQTKEEWIQRWETVMRPHVGNPLVIGADLRNEVRGLWGTMLWTSWADAAEDAAERLLKMNRDWLMVIEGTSSANDLTGVHNRPISLSVPDKLIYSAHVYSWSGWGSLAGRYSLRTYGAFAADMRQNWGYLLEQSEAPVWVGEIGAPMDPDKGDANYWRNLMRYLKEVDVDFAYWAINPRKPHGNTWESYGLVADDWKGVVRDYRLRDMLGLMNVTVEDWVWTSWGVPVVEVEMAEKNKKYRKGKANPKPKLEQKPEAESKTKQNDKPVH